MSKEEKHQHKFIDIEEPEKVLLKDKDSLIVGYDLLYYRACKCGMKSVRKMERTKR